MSGIVKNSLFDVIRMLSPELNSLTCLRMYVRNAWLRQRPCSMILSERTPLRYRNIAKLLRIERHLTSLGPNPRVSLPIFVTVFRICFRISFDFSFYNFRLCMIVLVGVFRFVFG